MLQAFFSWLGLNIPNIQWSTNYNVSPATFWQYAVQAGLVLGIVLVVCLLRLVTDMLLSFIRHK